MNDIAFASATKLAAMIRQKKISSSELLELYLKRVEAYNPALNAIETFSLSVGGRPSIPVTRTRSGPDASR